MSQLPRRTFLRGLGTAIALPFLDAMTPAFAAPAQAGQAPCRLMFVYAPTGMHMKYWTPETVGADFNCGRVMTPLAEYRKDMLVLSGLAHKNALALGDGSGDHGRSAGSYLTGVHPKKTDGANIRCGVSVDQVIASAVGKETKFPSLQMTCEDGRQVGNCDSGYSCAYTNNISWRSETQPLPGEINPRTIFERLFGDADPSESAAARENRKAYKKSVLDFARENTERLKGTLGTTDRRKLDEYLYAVREIETRIEKSEKDSAQAAPDMEKPVGVPPDYAQHARLMFDLARLALQTDSTRVITFMLAREGSMRSYYELGISEAHHMVTHHQNNPELIEKTARINCYHMEQFAYFIEKLKNTPDGDGSLLDHSAIVYGSSLADPNRHEHTNLPTMIVGNAKGQIRTGRHVRYEKETPLSNLLLSLTGFMGLPSERFGDSDGKLQYLTDI